ncbi:unnamed protein product [Onchocerca flexuosa]|uniref:Photosystem II protein I n=1 Tax=Onchocerca flexuosa TaxID=387005 RepID=A0A183I0Q2_9BILA|nr:unnamed protein product [Onchocerca flexuosa]
MGHVRSVKMSSFVFPSMSGRFLGFYRWVTSFWIIISK